MTEAQITRSLEAYILWLLGKVMFTENHETTINRDYIPISQEIADATSVEDITPRSWGSVILTGTYQGGSSLAFTARHEDVGGKKWAGENWRENYGW
jgi:hypothetical protein